MRVHRHPVRVNFRRSLLLNSLVAGLSVTVPWAIGQAQAQSADEPDRTLQIVAPWEVNGLQPASSGFIFTRMQIAETLVDADEAGNFKPGLAESWQMSDDGLHWRFTLRPNARFHDGSRVTAASTLPSLEAARINPAVLSLAPIEAIEADGDRTVLIRLKSRYGSLPALLTHASTIILAPGGLDAQGKVSRIIATGPYRIDSLQPPQQLTAVRFDQYDGTRPEIARTRYLAASRAESRALMAESGQADLAYTLDPASLQRIRTARRLTVESTTLPRTTILKLNAGLPALKDVRMRRALSKSIDRQGIATALLRDPEMAAGQLFPASMPQWHDSTLQPLDYDVSGAQLLLAEAGWKKDDKGVLRNAAGEAMTLTLRTFADRPELPSIATALQDQWRRLGIAIEVDIGNSGDIPLGHRDGTLELGLSARNYGNLPDPVGLLAQDFAPRGGDWGAMGWNSPALDEILASLTAGTTPEAEAAKRRHEVSAILHSELPVIPVTWYRQQVAVGKRVENVRLDPFERSYRISDMRWRP
ncbi:MAG: ABC transporter substrate-binding protein [Lautropia sp.]|nr:ABC transporter substrate-binding protein [Lautropia sp.]